MTANVNSKLALRIINYILKHMSDDVLNILTETSIPLESAVSAYNKDEELHGIMKTALFKRGMLDLMHMVGIEDEPLSQFDPMQMLEDWASYNNANTDDESKDENDEAGEEEKGSDQESEKNKKMKIEEKEESEYEKAKKFIKKILEEENK